MIDNEIVTRGGTVENAQTKTWNITFQYKHRTISFEVPAITMTSAISEAVAEYSQWFRITTVMARYQLTEAKIIK